MLNSNGNLGLSPIALPTASRAQQADVPNGVLDVRNKGQSWMNKKQRNRGMWSVFKTCA